ncbi:unnamed protein product [Triticum turgidum subsp. durum]|uniref:Uncharacterized protein n=1 Tax=Triticum turgidum subsp. durum TaxID=4567 RepID=A0A9R0RW54_TRITD|nr:unnamed protein product [Triticum turgidum subsp. durum]
MRLHALLPSFHGAKGGKGVDNRRPRCSGIKGGGDWDRGRSLHAGGLLLDAGEVGLDASDADGGGRRRRSAKASRGLEAAEGKGWRLEDSGKGSVCGQGMNQIGWKSRDRQAAKAGGLAPARPPLAPPLAFSRVRINPACVAKPTDAAKKPKRPAGSLDHGEPPAKSVRCASGEVASAAAAAARNKKRPGPSPVSGVEALRVTKNQTSASPTQPPELTAPPKPPASSVRENARLAENQTSASSLRPLASCSMRELLEKARLAKARIAAEDAEAEAEAIHRREIERRRAEARREREQMVPTVEFNDPFIDFRDVFK